LAEGRLCEQPIQQTHRTDVTVQTLMLLLMMTKEIFENACGDFTA
jgi:hypothetical protein